MMKYFPPLIQKVIRPLMEEDVYRFPSPMHALNYILFAGDPRYDWQNDSFSSSIYARPHLRIVSETKASHDY